MKPVKDHETYFSRKKKKKKKIYGFNLQAICNDDEVFTYVSIQHKASTHDSTAFKSVSFYRTLHTRFDEPEYILADKAYQLEKHIITPFKVPRANDPARGRCRLRRQAVNMDEDSDGSPGDSGDECESLEEGWDDEEETQDESEHVGDTLNNY